MGKREVGSASCKLQLQFLAPAHGGRRAAVEHYAKHCILISDSCSKKAEHFYLLGLGLI